MILKETLIETINAQKELILNTNTGIKEKLQIKYFYKIK